MKSVENSSKKLLKSVEKYGKIILKSVKNQGKKLLKSVILGIKMYIYRKIEAKIADFLKSTSNKTLLVTGARQIGKTYIIRHIGTTLFENYIELNMVEDFAGPRLFEKVRTVQDFYIQMSMISGDKMKEKSNTLVFIDEIQQYPELLTLLKFLKQDNKFTYIASGSLLGVTLKKTTSIPIGSIEELRMFPLDFEEFLLANGFNQFAVDSLRQKFLARETLEESTHNKIMDLFKKYLLVGGLPDAVKSFLKDANIVNVRKIHDEIHKYYADDAAKYDEQNKLKISRVYQALPSIMENKKKRIVAQNIEGKKGKRFSDYQDEFDYLIGAGIALDAKAISNPVFPLIESGQKNLLKLYLNDTGILTNILYKHNVRAILDDQKSVNLGAVYESVVASELAAHGHNIFYYDNRTKGEVDFLIDDYDNLAVLPLEIKSGKDYSVHSSLNIFTTNDDYKIKRAIVFSNERQIKQKGKIEYLPIYYAMFV